jgi:hypothetical protein
MGDGWTILQKRQNNWDPLGGYQPPPPHLSVAFYGGTNLAQPGRAVLTIQNLSGVLPDSIEIEKANRTWQQPAEDSRIQSRYPGPAYGGPRTNGFALCPVCLTQTGRPLPIDWRTSTGGRIGRGSPIDRRSRTEMLSRTDELSRTDRTMAHFRRRGSRP